MVVKTRGRPATKAAAVETEPSKVADPKVKLQPDDINPPRVFILPKDISTKARIITLENPRYAKDSRYLVCPNKGFNEFTRIAAPKTTPKSWLLVPEEESTAPLEEELPKDETNDKEGSSSRAKGYVTKGADLFIATPIDSLFIILPALTPLPTTKVSDPPKKLFLSGDDYFDKLISISPHLGSFLRAGPLRLTLEKRMTAVCDTVDAGDETMFRINEEKLFKELLKKAKKMVEHGLPSSMEEKLVRKVLDVPVLSINRGEESTQEGLNEEQSTSVNSGTSTPRAESQNTQITDSSADTVASSISEASTAVTSISGDLAGVSKDEKISMLSIDAPEGVADLLRIRTAFFFICSNYIAPHLSDTLKNFLKSSASPIDFTSLDGHLASLTKLRQDALAARSMGDYSRKRATVGDDEEIETRAEKKRKQDEEDKRKKAGESRGVKNLKKVNTSGMKKMSDFFKKK
ncbi:putative ribonuclease h2 subunit b protein [Botrytis fragariae]|uniref:Ribonuclease H2 subunit B n=1 Tax=Botrytis fragariae TaxID=1964551 RepID=A0A8H6AMT8_9HELO|nr:putative ribonuclease h2 subunit b protein [Botrytis fragariae]KAF5870140.1 putative ribonuclease h2 subunit b protein [Botrytis fragariae]